MRVRLHRIFAIALLAVFPLLTGCFEDPVTQKVTIEFLPRDRAQITTKIEVNDDVGEGNVAARARIQDMRRQLEDEIDEWSKRYKALDADYEKLVVERSHGLIETEERTAEMDDGDVSQFFADTSLGVFVRGDEDWTEIAIYPGRSTRATRDERTRLNDRLDLWSSKLARYLDRTARVYRFLDSNPGLAEPFFTVIFSDFLPKERVEAAPRLSDAELALAEDLQNAMEDAWNVLLVNEDEAFSVNELSSLVYDPFPADVEVKVPGRVLDIVGFEPGEETNSYVARRTTFWNALESLRSKWVEPDPLTAWVNAARSGSRFDLDDFLSRPRAIHASPAPDEIRKAIEDEMRPLDEYRVRWRRN